MENIGLDTKKEFALFESFGTKPLVQSGLILIPKAEIRKLILMMIKKKIRVLGLDGFKLYTDNKIQPFMEYSAEYSRAQPTKKDFEEFLSSVSEKITHFDVVVDK